MKINLMTFNILNQEIPPKPHHNWNIRQRLVVDVFKKNHIDIAGLQEPNFHQIKDLEKQLSNYKWIGEGLEDGKEKGAFNPIFYHIKHLKLIDYATFYLSPTPHIPSMGWDAYYPRGVTWAKFEDIKSNKSFYHFNTHLDYHGQRARNESAKLLKSKILQICGTSEFVVTGDFNIFSELGGDITFKALTTAADKSEAVLIDAESKALELSKGPTWTWAGFEERGEAGVKPDYIFVSKNMKVLTHKIIPPVKEGQQPSDHLPIIAELEI